MKRTTISPLKAESRTRNAAIASAKSISALCFLLFALAPAKAQTPNPPGQISYQGFLTDANGFPLATNNPVNYNVQFRVWNNSSGGSNLWGELQVVTVDRGYFTVLLGNGSSLPAVPFTNNLAGIFSGSDASDRYLEMTVQGLAPNDPPIQPRLRFLTTPYSFMASKVLDSGLSANVALRAGGNTFSGDQTITGGNIFLDNFKGIVGKNSVGAQEAFLYPRLSDNGSYLFYGSGGFNIMNDGGSLTAMFMANNGNVGVGMNTPGFPLNFPSTLGDKISLWGNSGNHFGFGIAPSTLQIFTDIAASDIAFGWGQSSGLSETLRIKGNGNVGIGTPSPGAKLDVRGDVKMGSAGDVYASGGQEKLRIVRGVVRNDGTIFDGAGFTVTKNGTGSYTLNFNPTFGDVPAVTISPAPGPAAPVTATWNNGNYNNILIETWSGSSHADTWFNFIAVGAR